VIAESWAFRCESCSVVDGGYVSEIAARRAEVSHMETMCWPDDEHDRWQLELTIKRNKLAELEREGHGDR
jgi:hypothetical protein